MTLAKYLWQSRAKPRLASGRWCKSWCKRIWTLPRLAQTTFIQHSLIARGAKIEASAFIGPVMINGNAVKLAVGRDTFIGRVTLHLHDRINIGRGVVINDGAVILTAGHDIRSATFELLTAPIAIGDYAWIATNAVLLPGADIGVGAVVGAGAVVRGKIPPYRVAIGNPACLLDRTRARNLTYSPVRLVALFDAWLGDSKSV